MRTIKRILVLDDDISIGDMLQEVLEKQGYKVFRAYSGTEALFVIKSSKPDLILLDLMLPGLNGEEVLPKIKDIPVIVVSAKIDIDNKVNLLLGGAVDYITKPFNIKELLARISIQFRNKKVNSNTINFDDIVMDINSHMVYIDDKLVKLTKTEYAILKLLMNNPSQVVTKSTILDKISEDTPDCVESSLKVHISNLRRKLKNISDKDYIESVWGIGFKMREE